MTVFRTKHFQSGDLRQLRWMYLKAVLLLCVGGLAGTLLLLDRPTWRTAGLLAAAVWAFCRAYYFAFYVIEKYVDPGFRFSGLVSVARFVLARRASGEAQRSRGEEIEPPMQHR